MPKTVPDFAVTALGWVEFAVSAAAYFLAQAPILMAVVVVLRLLRGAEKEDFKGSDCR
jgi:hypothetical protein